MLNELERAKSPGIGYKRGERSRATREERQKRRKKAWVEIHIRAFSRYVILPNALWDLTAEATRHST